MLLSKKVLVTIKTIVPGALLLVGLNANADVSVAALCPKKPPINYNSVPSCCFHEDGCGDAKIPSFPWDNSNTQPTPVPPTLPPQSPPLPTSASYICGTLQTGDNGFILVNSLTRAIEVFIANELDTEKQEAIHASLINALDGRRICIGVSQFAQDSMNELPMSLEIHSVL